MTEMERHIFRAAPELADRINAGVVTASGWRVSEGVPGGEVARAEYVSSISVPTSAGLCVIPVEWIGVSNGGWLLCHNEVVRGYATGERFCRVTVDAEHVKKAWPAADPSHGKIVECMTAEAERVFHDDGWIVHRDHLINHAVETLKVTHAAANAAHKDVPPWLKLGCGKKNRRKT